MATATGSRAVGVFETRAEAQETVQELRRAGFRPDQMEIVAGEGAHPGSGTDDRYYQEALRQGRTLVRVYTEERYNEAVAILSRCGSTFMAAPYTATSY